MIQINLLTAKEWLFKNWAIIALIIVSFLYFRSCEGGKELQLANAGLKKEAKELVLEADKYVAKNNALNDKITLLENQKQKVKTEIVNGQKKTNTAIKKTQSLSTKQIGNYYQERYKLPVVMTKYGVSLSDTIAKKNIVELIEKDGCFEEIKLVKTELKIEEQKGVLKDTVISNVTKANILLHKANFKQRTATENAEKSFRKERNKKTFWQVASGSILIAAGYLLIVK